MPRIDGNAPKVGAGQPQIDGAGRPDALVGKHTVKIGANSPVNLAKVGSERIQFLGFSKVTRKSAASAKMGQVAQELGNSLVHWDGNLDVKDLWKKLNTFRAYMDKYASACRAGTVDFSEVSLSKLASVVQGMSNEDLVASFGALCSHDMDALRSALQYEIMNDLEAKRISSANLELLSNLEALIVSEASKRCVADRLIEGPEDQRVHIPTLTENHHSDPVLSTPNPAMTVRATEEDRSALSMGAVMETAARSSMTRGKAEQAYDESVARKRIAGPALREMGDYIRGQQLTINVDARVLFGNMAAQTFETDVDAMPASNPDFRLKNSFDLIADGTYNQGKGYFEVRKTAEDHQFPTLKGSYQGKHRPVYGAFNLSGGAIGAAFQYGSAALVMKPHVKRSATYVCGDSLDVPVLTMTPENEDAFVSALKKRDDLITPDGLADLDDENSEVRKMIKGIFASGISIELSQVRNNDALRSLLGALKLVACPADSPEASERDNLLKACLITTCLDTAKHPSYSASYEDVETLIPHLDERDMVRTALNLRDKEGNLRKANANHQLFFENTAYIEAQIHQPIDLARDVEEVIVAPERWADAHGMALSEAEVNKIKAAILEWGKRNGVKVTFVSNEIIYEKYGSMESHRSALKKEVAGVFKPEKDKAVDAFLRESIEDGTLGHTFIRHQPDWRELEAFLGETHLLGGAFLSAKAFQPIEEAVKARMASREDFNEAEANIAIDSVLDKLMPSKLELIRELMNHREDYQFDSPAQKNGFVKWVLESRALKNVAEMKLIYQNARALMQTLKGLADGSVTVADLPMKLMELLDKLEPQMAEYIAGLEPGSFGSEDKKTNFDRVVFMAITMLKQSGELPEGGMGRIADAFSSEPIRQFSDMLFSADTFVGSPKDIEATAERKQAHQQAKAEPGWELENSRMLAMVDVFSSLELHLGGEIPGKLKRMASHPIEQMGGSARSEFNHHFPVIGAFLDKVVPCKLRTLTQVRVPGPDIPMPKTLQERRKFLLKCMPEYREHERTFDKGIAYHGRSHVARTFVFANVLGNIMQERGVDVDVDAAAMMVAGHDIGRRGNGEDVFEAESARRTNETILASIPEGAPKPDKDFLDAVTHAITSTEASATTVEAYLLHSADSLDYSRCGDIDMKRFPFMRETILAGDMMVNVDEATRKQLVKEAELLTQMTQPLYLVSKQAIKELDLTTDASRAEYKKRIAQGREIMSCRTEEMTDEEVLREVEIAIRTHPQAFPLLNRYYHD